MKIAFISHECLLGYFQDFLKKENFDLLSKLNCSFSFLFPGPNPFPKVFQIPSVIHYEQEKWDFRAGPDFRSGDEKAFRGVDRKTRIDCRTLARIACSGENKKNRNSVIILTLLRNIRF